MDKINLEFHSRFPIKQTGEHTFVIEIRRDPDAPEAISEAFAKQLRLSEAEYMKAERAALRSIAIISE